MNLALGKFGKENFSRFSKKFSAVEVDLQGYLLWDERDRLRFRTWIAKKGIGVLPRISLRTSRSREEFQDLFQTAREEFGEALRLFQIASGRRRFDSEQDSRSRREFRQAMLNAGADLFFEWGEEDTDSTTRWICGDHPGSGMILDLDYHWKYREKAGLRLHFKLHGWHPERWMRRYGPSLISKYRKRLDSFPGAILILAHSGRIEEAPEFE